MKAAQKIPFFRGVYTRTSLPIRPKAKECAIVNLDSDIGPGTHWVAYVKHGCFIKYFDSFGNLKPPLELQNYFGDDTVVMFNRARMQSFDSSNCGYLCLKFLKTNSK